MSFLERRFSVDFQYRVDFTTDLFDPANLAWASVVDAEIGPARCAVVIDAGVAQAHPHLIDAVVRYAGAHPERLMLAGPPTVFEGGEACKNDSSATDRVLQLLDHQAIDRHAYVMAIGGGAFLDMVGFAAGICHRGVRLIRVPTTTLAQNDSGVGVKNSVNRFGKKNFLGTFAPPSAVLVDPAFLTTLHPRDWRACTAEAVKVALLKDPAFFAWIESNAHEVRAGDLDAMSHLVKACAALHMDHIATSGDPFELGSSRPLDFGHWAAHKLESITDFALRHGEAVAIGLALDVALSHVRFGLPFTDVVRIWQTLQGLGLPLTHPALFAGDARQAVSPAVLEGLEEFRQHLGGRLTIMLLRGIGEGVEVHDIDPHRVSAAVRRVAEFERFGLASPKATSLRATS
ncbi:MAG: 3-dehydroquinate synthase [Myxococcota bacterium]